VSGQGDGGTEARSKTGPVIHEMAAAVVTGFCRLVKACQFHTDVTNEVITSLTTAAELSVQQYCEITSNESAAISFLGDAVFVNRQILKASRDVHTLALGLGELLGRSGVTEIAFAKTAKGATICAFAKLVADAEKEQSLGRASRPVRCRASRPERRSSRAQRQPAKRRRGNAPRARTRRRCSPFKARSRRSAKASSSSRAR
jgi:hypothetical protein